MACICVPYLPSQIGELSVEDLYYIIIKMADIIDRNKDYLSMLDMAIGDGDHGINMSKAFNNVVNELRVISLSESDVKSLLMIIADAFSDLSGEASGELYGMLFKSMAYVANGMKSLDLGLLVKMLENGVHEIMRISGAKPGDKTMIDVLYPVMEELMRNSMIHNDIFVAMRRALEVAELNLLSTKNMIAKKGKASQMAEKSVGYQDPGATSSYLLLEAFYNYVLNKAETY